MSYAEPPRVGGAAVPKFEAADAGKALVWDGAAWTKQAASGISATLVDVKGDLLVGSAADAVGRLAAGANGQILTADTAAPLGLKWAAAPSGGGGSAHLFDEAFAGDLSAYTADAGFEVAGGTLRPVAGATGTRIAQRTGVSVVDSVQVVRYRVTAAEAGAAVGIVARRLDATSYIWGVATDGGLHLQIIDAGAVTDAGGIAISPPLNRWLYLRLGIVDDVARVEFHDAHPDIGNRAPIAIREVTSLPTRFVGAAGGVGVRMDSGAGNRAIGSHRATNLSG